MMMALLIHFFIRRGLIVTKHCIFLPYALLLHIGGVQFLRLMMHIDDTHIDDAHIDAHIDDAHIDADIR